MLKAGEGHTSSFLDVVPCDGLPSLAQGLDGCAKKPTWHASERCAKDNCRRTEISNPFRGIHGAAAA